MRLQGLETLKSLKILSIQSNRITKLENLEELTNLEELYISHNGLEKIEGLEKNVRRSPISSTLIDSQRRLNCARSM